MNIGILSSHKYRFNIKDRYVEHKEKAKLRYVIGMRM